MFLNWGENQRFVNATQYKNSHEAYQGLKSGRQGSLSQFYQIHSRTEKSTWHSFWGRKKFFPTQQGLKTRRHMRRDRNRTKWASCSAWIKLDIRYETGSTPQLHWKNASCSALDAWNVSNLSFSHTHPFVQLFVGKCILYQKRVQKAKIAEFATSMNVSKCLKTIMCGSFS